MPTSARRWGREAAWRLGGGLELEGPRASHSAPIHVPSAPRLSLAIQNPVEKANLSGAVIDDRALHICISATADERNRAQMPSKAPPRVKVVSGYPRILHIHAIVNAKLSTYPRVFSTPPPDPSSFSATYVTFFLHCQGGSVPGWHSGSLLDRRAHYFFSLMAIGVA